MITFDTTPTYDAAGNNLGRKLDRGYTTHDGKTVDSTGAFMVGELERLDQKMHEPLVSITWPRDIDLREDVTIGDEASSFTVSTFASAGGIAGGNIGTGKAWASKDATAITGIGIDIGKLTQPLIPWAMELKYSIMELESAIQLGRPVDSQKYAGLMLKHQMDIDEMVYIGDTSLSFSGLVNNVSGQTAITPSPVAAGVSGFTQWAKKSPDEILVDVNNIIEVTWANSAYAVIPDRIRIPPAQYNTLISTKVSLAGNLSVLKFLAENNILTQSVNKPLDIQPTKWLVGAGTGGTIGTLGTVDRMVAYTREVDRVRYPMTPLQRTPVQYHGMYHVTTYFCKLGVMEFVYPETVSYNDGI